MFLFVVSLFFVSAGNSQDEKSFRLGLFGASNISWFNPSSEWHKNDGTRPAWGYGLMTEFSLADNYSLETGLYSSYSGGKLKWDSTATTIVPPDTIPINVPVKINSEYKFQSLEIPLALKMKTNEINSFTFFAKFGGTLSLLIDSKADYEYMWGETKISLDNVNVKKDVIFIRVAFIVGAGIEYSLGGSTSAVLGINFNNGLTPIFNTGENSVHRYDDNKKKAINNYVTINLGFIF